MLKRIFLYLFMGILIGNSFAQDYFSNFSILKSEGKMPNDFKKYLTSDIKEDMNLKRLFSSGLIVYGSELNIYVEKVADQLLKDFPDLRNKMRFYILKSTVVNAYAFNDHIIIINLGLLAQIQNESELAFILAHEMVHIVNNHIEIEKKERKKKNKYDSTKDKFLSYHNRSRDHEYESDKEGFIKFYEKSGYSLEAINGVFDVLQYGYLPFDEFKFDREFVETNFYKFPDNYFLVNLSPIRSREDFIDTLSTHPNILKRRTIMQDMVENSSYINGASFIQPETLFYKIRNIARFECLNQFVKNHEYANSFYNAYIMLKEFPDNQFINQTIYYSLYGIAKHKNKESISELLGSYKQYEGEIQQMYHFLIKINKDESSILALRFAWAFSKKFPENQFVKLVINDIVKDLHKRKKLNYQDYSDYPQGLDISNIQTENPKTDSVQNTQSKNRFEKIKSTQNKTKVIPTERFKTQNYMLVDLRQDSLFMDLVENNLKQIEDKDVLDIVDDGKFNDAICNSMIIFAPKYYQVSNGKLSIKNEKIEKLISSTVTRQNVEANTIFDTQIEKFDTEQYNHYCKIQEFYSEYSHSSELQIVYSQSNNIEDACLSFGGTCINFVEVYKEKTFLSSSSILLFIPPMYFVMPFIPELFVHIFLRPSTLTVNYIVVNLMTGERITSKRETIEGKNNAPALNNLLNHFYDLYSPKKGNSK